MWARRGARAALVFVVGVAGVASAASAQEGSVFQAVPVSEWVQPGTALLDGIGQFVYVAETPPGVGQVTTTGYLYEQILFFPEHQGGQIGLSSDAQGHLAGMHLGNSTVEIRYPWTSGRIYFLFTYHLGGDAWGGWVYDYSGNAWTYIGQVQASPGSGLLSPMSATEVEHAQGILGDHDPFGPWGLGPVPTCSASPRVDAYFYPPIGYRGTTATVASPGDIHRTAGTCPTGSTTEYGWSHYQLGATPAGRTPGLG